METNYKTQAERSQLILNNLLQALEVACFPEGANKITREQMRDFSASGIAIITALLTHIIRNNNQTLKTINGAEDEAFLQELFLQELFKAMEKSVRKNLDMEIESADKSN